ncbi:MAG TPA: spore coat U domain-containing protein [Thermoanaerobaculia bacterium]|nr:spore coat U domain-containing protein [Thermoanaerobaculia bacterium]
MKNLKSLTILGILLIAAVPTFAASSTADIAVSANVAKMCEIEAGSIDFGAYDPWSATAVNGSGTFRVRCTKSADAVTVGLGDGLNLDRTMGNGTDFLAYSLLDGAAAWTDAAPKSVTFATSGWQTLTISGTLAAGQDVSDGSYTDTVVATINF